MCGLTGHGMNRDTNSGWRVLVFGRADWWMRFISRVVVLTGMLGAGLSHAQEAPAPLPEVSLAASPVMETAGPVSTQERTGVASSSVTSVTEGTDAVFTLERTGATSEALAVMVRLSETGSMLSNRPTAAGNYEYLTVTFGVGESSVALRAPTDDDTVMEDPSTVTAWLLPDVSTDYTVGSARLARVTVTDNDTATFTVIVVPAEIAEGETAAIVVNVEGGVFAQNQPITLDFSGDAQASDYRVADTNNRPLTAPYTLILPAGEVAVTAAVTALADGEAESAETVVVEARHDSVVIGTANLTIAASDAALENEAKLASLSLSDASMGAFFSDVFDYRADVGSGIASTMIRAPPENPRATVSVSATGASLQNEGAWMVPLASGANTVSITVTSADRLASTTYTITVYRAAGVAAWGGRDAAGDFDLPAEQGLQTLPAGLWSDGEFLWVADWETGSLLAYSLADKSRRPGWDFSPLAAGSPAGMWSDGRTLWVADYHAGGIYAYSMANGERLPDQDISLAQGNDDPTGIWSDGDTLWVADYLDRKAYAYGLRDGARRTGADIDFNADEEAGEAIHPFDIWSDGETLWVANWLGGELRAYRLEGGERLDDKDIGLSLAGNDYPMGIWSDGATLYVSDISNTRIHAYTAVRQFAYDEALQAVPSDNALLETLSLSGVDLGNFSSEVMSYSATVGNDVRETVVEAVAADANASLRISGPGGTSQGGRRTVPLSVGLNVISITVTAQTGSVNTYSVVVFRTMSLTPGDASLHFLSLSGINIGNFTSTVTEYAASVEHTLETTRVRVLPADDDASVVITAAGGADSTEGRQKDVALAQGRNTITITVTAPEETTQTYSVVLTRAEPPPAVLPAGDVDPPTPIPVTAVTLMLSSASISENGGVSTVTAALSHASNEATTVTVSAEPVAPANSSDYSLSANTVLSIAAGATSSSGTVTISARNNDVDAPNKMVTVKGSASNNLGVSGPADLSLSITDDDTRGVTVSVTALNIDEGGTGTYTVVLDSEPAGQVTVTPARSSGDSGVSVSGPLSFTALTWDTPQTVTVSAGEDADALDDTAEIGHTVSGADYGSVTAVSVTVTVDDDETDSTGVTLSVSPDTVGEGAGATTVTVTAALNGGSQSTATAVTVTVGLDTAVSGTDFTAVTGFTITIAANQVSGTGTFGLTPTDDTVDEPDETVVISGSAPGSLTVTPAAVTIIDNDASPAVTLALSSASISENGGVSTVTAALSSVSSKATTVTVAAEAVAPALPADFTQSGAALTIAAGQTTSTGAVTITAVDNSVDAPGKTVTVSATAANDVGVGAPANKTLTITDGEAAPAVTLLLTPASIAENGEVSTVTAALDHASSEATTVTVSAAAVAPALAGDFRLNGAALTIAAGQTTSTGAVTITAVDNSVFDAADKSVTVSAVAVNSQGVTNPADVTLMITDDEAMVGSDHDYDTDNDGLIEVINLAQLNVIRHDLDGDGEADGSANAADYGSAFPDAAIGMGCPGTCTGYELTADLDFAGTDWSRGSGWEPIRTESNKFTATFHGNGRTISNLFINRASAEYAGLFGYSAGVIRNLGLERVNVHGGRFTAGLVARTDGEVSASYVTGRVAAASGSMSGGLAGFNAGTIRTSYARASVGVDISRRAGGLVGENDSDGVVLASYAAGSVSGTAQAGGLAAWNKGPVKISYSVSRVWDNGEIAGGFFGGQSRPPSGVTYNGNYWQTRDGLARDGVDFDTGQVEDQISEKTATELQSPVSKTSGIYQTWDDEDVTGDNAADDPWDLGTSAQYPVLQVDFDGDGRASWEEFGEQRRGEALAADWEADHPSSNGVSDTWTDFLWAREDGRQAVLPDFSYAGYKYFSEEPPDVTHQIFNVTDYGAVANDNRSDQGAIQAAIDAAEANGSGIVFFPAGEFLVNTDEDPIANPLTQTNSSITVQSSNIVLRGSGSREGGTIIRQVNDLPEITPGDKWTPPYMFLFRDPGWTDEDIVPGAELTTISGDAPRGAFWIEVADTAQLRVGQRIVLYMAGDTGAVSEFLAPYSIHEDWESLRNTGVRILERHSIAEIRGNRVRLNEPLHALKIKGSYNVQVTAPPPLIEEAGVEDISFQGSWPWKFKHHQNARHNSGWSLLRMRGCVNCWVRRVSLVNVNRALEVDDSAAVSVYQVTIKGNRGHFGYRNLRNYGAWFGLVEDLPSQQHGMNTMSLTTGSVHWRNDQVEHQRTDFHGDGPYANLTDCLNRGRLASTSGHYKYFPSHHRHTVFWNFKHDHEGSSSVHYDVWTKAKWGVIAHVKPIIVGFHGDPATFSQHEQEVLESNGSAVNPECLFEAQLETRLGSVPAWLDGLRTEWAALRATSLPVPTVFAMSGIDDLALEMGSSHTVDVEDNFEVLHNRSISSYSASSSDMAVATVSTSGSVVTISPVAQGKATITVTASSSAGDTATQKFEVTVTSSNARTQANQRKNAGSGSNLRTSTPATTERLAEDAKLSALRLSGVNFGAFDSAETNYSAAVAHDIPAIEVVAAPADAGASVVIEDANGGTAGRRRTVALAEGENTISIAVTAEDGRTTRTYRVIVTRGPEEWVRDARSFELDRNNTAPAGLWSDRNTLWVADWEERKLFAYGLPEGGRLLDRDIAVAGAPMGLWSDGETIWVVNHHGGLQAYRLADGGRVPGRGLELAGSAAPVGLWSDGTTVWVSEWLDRTVKAYLLADGGRVPSRDVVVDDAVETLLAAGVWADGLTLWLADWSVDQVRALGLSDGLLEAGRSVATASAGYADPAGLWSDGATLWVTAWNGERVHVHALPPAVGAGPTLRPATSAFARGAVRLAGENRKLNLGTTATGSIAGADLRVNGMEPQSSGQAGVSIADPILRGRILAALGKAAEQPLGVADMAELKVLNLRHAGVADLSGLEHAVHLEELDLGFNPVADLSALAALPALASLDLDGVSLANLAPLSSLTGLSRLSLRDNAIVELTPLAELSRLTRLDLGGNQIANLYPLSGLTELTELWLDGNRISDLSALAPLTRLTQLDLSDNRIRYLHALSGMRRLETLKLAGNGLSQLYPLSGLTGLRTLVLRGNAIKELQPLSHLGELRSLDVHGNRISGLHPLSGLRSLVWLDICHNPIEDFSPAYGLSARIILGNAEQHQGISN